MRLARSAADNMVCEHEFMVGLALAAAKRQWPQPLVIRDGKLHLTQPFIDFHQDEVVRRKLVLLIKLNRGELFFVKREHVLATTSYIRELKIYNYKTHLACLMEHEDEIRVIITPFTKREVQRKLPVNYCLELNECEMPCEDLDASSTSTALGLGMVFDVLQDMKAVGLTLMDAFQLLDPYITRGDIVWKSQAPFSVKSLDVALSVQAEAQRRIDRVKFTTEWTPGVLRMLRLVK